MDVVHVGGFVHERTKHVPRRSTGVDDALEPPRDDVIREVAAAAGDFIGGRDVAEAERRWDLVPGRGIKASTDEFVGHELLLLLLPLLLLHRHDHGHGHARQQQP